jgi:hypothetical protein
MKGRLRRQDDVLHVDINRESDLTTFQETGREGDTVNLHLEAKGGRQLTQRYCAEIRAALLKIAIEFLWLDDHKLATSAAMSHVADLVMGARESGFVALRKRGRPDHNEVTVTINPVQTVNGTALAVQAEIYGVLLGTTSMLAGPVPTANDDFEVWQIDASDQ